MADRRSRQAFVEMEQAFNRLETKHPGVCEGMETDGETYMRMRLPKMGLLLLIKTFQSIRMPVLHIYGLHQPQQCLHLHAEDDKAVSASVHGLSVTRVGNPNVVPSGVWWDAYLHLSGQKLSSDSGLWVEKRIGDKFFQIELTSEELEKLVEALLNAPPRAVMV